MLSEQLSTSTNFNHVLTLIGAMRLGTTITATGLRSVAVVRPVLYARPLRSRHGLYARPPPGFWQRLNRLLRTRLRARSRLAPSTRRRTLNAPLPDRWSVTLEIFPSGHRLSASPLGLAPTLPPPVGSITCSNLVLGDPRITLACLPWIPRRLLPKTIRPSLTRLLHHTRSALK